MTYDSGRVRSGECVLNSAACLYGKIKEDIEYGKRLGSLEPGDLAVVDGFSDGGRNIAGRLRDIGVENGTVIECVGKSPLGDPRAFKIRGAVVALRKEDADVILTRAL